MIRRLKLSPEQSNTVQKVIDRLRSQSLRDDTFGQDSILQQNVLPLYQGWAACSVLTPTGDIFWMPEDPVNMGGNFDIDETLFRASLVAGACRYPELSFLIPERKEGAVNCPMCQGTGKPALPELGNITCECGGLGWIDP